MDRETVFNWILLALGFGFVIFWHELGHFLAAKWAKVKVEQFAVGFGTAALAWRKGIGVRVGTTRPEYEKRCREYLRSTVGGNESNVVLADAASDDQQLDSAGRALGLGETEYRLNWLPLGGYVKMLGQDDLDPTATVTDPRAYNMQPISKRMVIVSAGVVMNIVLAAIGFFALFLIGFKVQPPVVGMIAPGSPAQKAGLEVGDRILTLDGKPQLDFTKIFLNVALLPDDRDVPVEVMHPNGKKETFSLRPARPQGDQRGMLAIGIAPEPALAGRDPAHIDKEDKFDPVLFPAASQQIKPDDVITKVNGRDVESSDDPKRDDYYIFDRAVQNSHGKPIELVVRGKDGSVRTETVQPGFELLFNDVPLDFAGMTPRAQVEVLNSDSVVKGKLLPGDVITAIRVLGPNDSWDNPTRQKLMEMLDAAGKAGNSVELTVLRDGKEVKLDPVVPSLSLSQGRKGLGVSLNAWDAEHPIVADIAKDSSAAQAGIPRGATIGSIDHQPIKDWNDVKRVMAALAPDRAVAVEFKMPESNETKSVELHPTREELARIASYRYSVPLLLRERIEPRKTKNFVEAARWGMGETRDLIVQFYLTIKRMIQRSVPASNLMGPLGIVQAGSKFAHRGTDWLLWFLSMISANLAVVNFLPIPIVDGGLFLFLIIEKLQGRPLSPRTMSIAQVVGLALILSVFVFVTYQDIVR